MPQCTTHADVQLPRFLPCGIWVAKGEEMVTKLYKQVQYQRVFVREAAIFLTKLQGGGRAMWEGKNIKKKKEKKVDYYGYHIG